MDVHLLVYDLSRGLARQMSMGLLGFQLDAVYHTSIKFNGREYVYDGQIVAIRPGSSHLGQPMQELPLGKTELPMDVIEEYLDSLREIYTVEAYDLWRHNCNNFSNDFAMFLLGKGIPEHITNMPQTVLDSPFGQMLMPALSQQVNASKQKGGILGIQQTATGSSVKKPSEFHHQQAKVQMANNLTQLDQLLSKHQHSCAVVFFTSATCPPCKTIYPLYDQLAAEVGDRGILIKVDTSQAFDAASKYSVNATPTFITFLKGQQENRWSGADPGALQGNIQLLVQMAWPPHPHQSLNLPTLSNPHAKPVLYSKIPPIPKLLAKMGPETSSHRAIKDIAHFIETSASEGPAESPLPANIPAFTSLVVSSLQTLPADLVFTVIDLLRCALIDPRFSGVLAEESDHKTIVSILNHVNVTLHSTCPYALRLVTLQMACNLFSSGLYPDQILAYEPLRSAVTQLISTSFLDDGHANIRVAASGLLYNIALANSVKRREGPGDLLSEGDQVELAASVLEAITQEEGSKEALEGMLLGLGYLGYRMPLDGDLAEFLRTLEAGATIKGKKSVKDCRGDTGRAKEGALLERRSREVLADVKETLIGISLDPRLMPDSAGYREHVAAERRGAGGGVINMPSPQTPRSFASTPSLRCRDGTVPALARMDPGGNVRVVVRVRGFLPREIKRDAQCLIRMDPDSERTTLMVPNNTDPANARARARKVVEDKSFEFDKSFWSHDPRDPHYATQEDVYDSLGEEFLDHNFEGYHTCIFAYGQTGSGKSYTMMGTPDEPGLIPRTCEDLFQRISEAEAEADNVRYTVRVSYFEVYNEHVRDLLVPVVPNQAPYYLKIRESPTEGPYVKDLTEVPVHNYEEIIRHMRTGDENRTVASTKMNDTSSRSHAVFTIMLKQIYHNLETDETTERSSRIRLVDLAGSERAKSTEATGARLREGSNINKSLTTLGRVIAALADPKKTNRGGTTVVPYRDSILTWLLKDSLGGNSKTAMIACIAPSDYEETLSTLRYADQAKRIRTRAVVNQDKMSTAERDARIAEMEEEIRALQLVVNNSQNKEKTDARKAEEKLEEYQVQVKKLQQMMEERSMIAEAKMRSLQTQNEALRLHLKLAVESLRNPIAVPPPAVADKDEKEDEDEDEAFYEGEEEEEEEEDNEEEDEAYRNMEETLEFGMSLLRDARELKRKLADDRERFREREPRDDLDREIRAIMDLKRKRYEGLG
ncbi:P-loop containing nucleoside triphosphate hydrolase protein [Cladorrhinum samala]|uniref:P-loop containing nucleoside triphosphate hydrolase protein n=1 Tax=Cladorrhinum samala TaxID=585594 RepID=A0AAV9HBH2_9PEZI|nr:P-loop containing nucleoside triphosphate hydrolase protein [Cladorrhinum samala]